MPAASQDRPSASLAPREGVTPPSPDRPRHRFLSDALVAGGLVDAAAMEQAVDRSRAGGGHYSEVLVEEGAVTAEDMARAIAGHVGIDHVDLDRFAVDPQAAELPGATHARALGGLPIAVLESGAVVVALHDPERCDLVKVGDLLGREVQPAVASRAQLEPRLRPDPRHRPADAPVLTVVPAETASASASPGPVRPAPDADPAARLREVEERLREAEARADAMAQAAAAANEALGHLAAARADGERAEQAQAATLQTIVTMLGRLADALGIAATEPPPSAAPPVAEPAAGPAPATAAPRTPAVQQPPKARALRRMIKALSR